jgi:hypothetical protein
MTYDELKRSALFIKSTAFVSFIQKPPFKNTEITYSRANLISQLKIYFII